MVCRAIRRTAQSRAARRTPAARVGLHQTLANSRETIHTIPKCIGTRAPGSKKMEPDARGRRDFRNTGPRAATRPEPLAVPSTLARRRPAAPAVGPRRRSRLAARALDRFATNMPAQTPSGARVAALQQALTARQAKAPPLQRVLLCTAACLEPQGAPSAACSLQPASPNGLEPIYPPSRQ